VRLRTNWLWCASAPYSSFDRFGVHQPLINASDNDGQ
jgi:hypothetical protein